jgi:hypothetical protein
VENVRSPLIFEAICFGNTAFSPPASLSTAQKARASRRSSHHKSFMDYDTCPSVVSRRMCGVLDWRAVQRTSRDGAGARDAGHPLHPIVQSQRERHQGLAAPSPSLARAGARQACNTTLQVELDSRVTRIICWLRVSSVSRTVPGTKWLLSRADPNCGAV